MHIRLRTNIVQLTLTVSDSSRVTGDRDRVLDCRKTVLPDATATLKDAF